MLLDTPICDFGWKAQPFKLSDPGGYAHSLESSMGKSGLLIAFICNHCPYVKAIIERLVTDAKTLQDEGIGIVAIMSNDYKSVPADSPPEMKKFAKRFNFSFPYLVDEDQTVGRSYRAVCTPDFFGFNNRYELQYRGRLDDAKMENPANRTPELLEAMRLIAKTGSGPQQQTPSIGLSLI